MCMSGLASQKTPVTMWLSSVTPNAAFTGPEAVVLKTHNQKSLHAGRRNIFMDA